MYLAFPQSQMLRKDSRLLAPSDTWLILIGRPNDLSGLYSLSVFYFYWSPVLVVVIGKARVKTQNDDDHCPQNDQ